MLNRDLRFVAAAREVKGPNGWLHEMWTERQPRLNEVWSARTALVCTPEEASQGKYRKYTQRKTEEDWNGRVGVLCEISSSTLTGSEKTHLLVRLGEISFRGVPASLKNCVVALLCRP